MIDQRKRFSFGKLRKIFFHTVRYNVFYIHTKNNFHSSQKYTYITFTFKQIYCQNFDGFSQAQFGAFLFSVHEKFPCFDLIIFLVLLLNPFLHNIKVILLGTKISLNSLINLWFEGFQNVAKAEHSREVIDIWFFQLTKKVTKD